jgi:transposase
MGRFQKDHQRSFADPEVLLLEHPLPPESFPVRFRTICDRLLPDALFDQLYSSNGRPGLSPSLLTRLLLLELKFGRSDREAVDDLQYDLRWQFMCDVRATQVDLHPTTLVYHRLRLLFGTINQERIATLRAQGILLRDTPAYTIFASVRDAAVALGLLPPEAPRAVDSTAILGLAAVKDTYQLLFQGLRAVVQAHAAAAPAAQPALLEALARPEYAQDDARKPAIDWTDADARAALLTDYVHDAACLLVACQELTTPAVQAALAQLQRLLGQDVTVNDAGRATLVQGVARDRQCSIVDPEMRHGRKSASKRFTGSKVHVIAEPTSGLITGITATPASTHDGQALPELLAQEAPPLLVGDQAYGGAEVRLAALQAGTVVHTPALAATAQPYHKDQFALDTDAGTVTCPGGQTRAVPASGRVTFPAKLCQGCPHQATCNPAGKGRVVSFHVAEELLRNLHAFARTAAGVALTAVRPVMERIIGHLVRWGIRQGRYIGTAKTGLQTVLGALGYNLDKISRLLQARTVPQAA